jgi:NAD(P)-dependent dehydrogenase (short-subunit alcohol dehydrogenase family)
MSAAANPRVALVTGANRGLGLETCRQLLGRGLRVAMPGRDENAVQHARHTLGDESGNSIAVRMDVTDPASIEAAHSMVVERFGAVDVVVNNAAVLLFESEDVLAIPAEGFRRTFEANLPGAIEVCRVFVPPMATRRYGRIVNVSSDAGQLANMSTHGSIIPVH